MTHAIAKIRSTSGNPAPIPADRHHLPKGCGSEAGDEWNSPDRETGQDPSFRRHARHVHEACYREKGNKGDGED